MSEPVDWFLHCACHVTSAIFLNLISFILQIFSESAHCSAAEDGMVHRQTDVPVRSLFLSGETRLPCVYVCVRGMVVSETETNRWKNHIP